MILSRRQRKNEKYIQILLIAVTLVFTVLRFLLNEKGRTNPDSIRFFRTSDAFPVIDNTTTPLGYPLSLKFFTLFGFDEFWASKIVGLLAYVVMLIFAWRKKFYFREMVMAGGLISYVSIFSYSMSEPLILPFVLVFLYICRSVIIGNLSRAKSVFYISLMLILMYNIRYSALFFMGACFGYGVLNFRKNFSKAFIISAVIGFAFIVLYKVTFIDYFNENYINEFLEIGLHPTSELLVELFQGLTTTFNPFVHIANPGGGIINYAIYGIGALTLLLMVVLFVKNRLSETEKFFVFVGITGIICSYFIQYFYSVNALDYRLLSPFVLPVWLVFFKKLFQLFGNLTYGITALSLLTGFAFSWLSRGDYLENRRNMKNFLTSEGLEKGPVLFYVISEENLDQIQVAELISTVNPNVNITFKPQDTLKKKVLTEHRVLNKIGIVKNKYQ